MSSQKRTELPSHILPDITEDLRKNIVHCIGVAEIARLDTPASDLFSEHPCLSSASLEIKDAGSGLSGVFSGNLSLDVTEGSKWRINRSGFCGMRSKKFDGFIDLDAYDTIALKLKGDGRCYISTIYTENWVNSPGQEEDNSWQAFVYVPKDNWYIVKIPLDRYLPTWRGNVIDAKLEMNPSRVVSMSLSVNAEGGVPGAKSGPGDFKVELDWIKALITQ